ncbi:unnamed protein product [Blepharisma stoltei]|uniref:Uncharacterized protein n=1 Tax=Blepharisma stoltei TaxID=1481888 RepID=A0AAU9K4R6_9CILI|nr:unnamed protein product [Blepharisma stoltei]
MNSRINNFYTQSLPSSAIAHCPEEYPNYSHESQYMNFRSSFPENLNKAPSPTEDLMSIRSITVFAKRFFELRNIKFRQVVMREKDKISAKVYINDILAGEQSHPNSFNRCRVISIIRAFDKDDVEILKEWMKVHKDDLENYLVHNKGDS